MTTANENQNQELKYLYRFFKKEFCGKIDNFTLMPIWTTFSFYVSYGTQKRLENFVKEYFIMRRMIVNNRNATIEYLQSLEYKHENFINKIKIKKELKHWQRLCNSINKFEEEFYERTNISLLRVENERWSAEQDVNEEQSI